MMHHVRHSGVMRLELWRDGCFQLRETHYFMGVPLYSGFELQIETC